MTDEPDAPRVLPARAALRALAPLLVLGLSAGAERSAETAAVAPRRRTRRRTDPDDGICPPGAAGRRAAPGCAGFVLCDDGHLMGGGGEGASIESVIIHCP